MFVVLLWTVFNGFIWSIFHIIQSCFARNHTITSVPETRRRAITRVNANLFSFGTSGMDLGDYFVIKHCSYQDNSFQNIVSNMLVMGSGLSVLRR